MTPVSHRHAENLKFLHVLEILKARHRFNVSNGLFRDTMGSMDKQGLTPESLQTGETTMKQNDRTPNDDRSDSMNPNSDAYNPPDDDDDDDE